MSKNNNVAIAPKRSTAGYRIVSILLALAPLAVFYFLPNYIFGMKEDSTFVNFTIIVIKGLMEGKSIFIYGTEILEYVVMAFTYIVPVVTVVNVLLALIAAIFGKTSRGLCRTIAYLGFWAYAGYAIAVVTTCLYVGNSVPFDYVMIALAAVFLIALVVLGFIKVGKKTWVALLLFLLNCAVAGALVYAICVAGNAGFAELLAESKLYTIVCAALIGCSAISLLISSARLLTKKGYCFDMVRYIIQLVVFVVLVAGLLIKYLKLIDLAFLGFLDKFDEKTQLIMLIAMGVAAVVSILQIIIAAVAKGKKAKKAKKAKEAAPAPVVAEEPAAVEEEAVVAPVVAEEVVEEEPVEEEIVEEEPVEEEVEEEEVYEEEEVVEEEEEEVIADEPTEENLSKDPFIATLTKSERASFTDTFILKIHGELKGLPDYVVGGNNKAFFRKVFVYLGVYRDKVSTAVLDKIYKFSHKDN